jgi:hypothetical protein
MIDQEPDRSTIRDLEAEATSARRSSASASLCRITVLGCTSDGP